jgi:hypothetical protein
LLHIFKRINMGYYAKNPHDQDEPPRCPACDECMVEMLNLWECHNPYCEDCSKAYRRRDKLERVATIAAVIFKVTRHSFRNFEVCPHGNGADFPTHGWWCDECWGELEAALDDLENLDEALADK